MVSETNGSFFGGCTSNLKLRVRAFIGAFKTKARIMVKMSLYIAAHGRKLVLKSECVVVFIFNKKYHGIVWVKFWFGMRGTCS